MGVLCPKANEIISKSVLQTFLSNLDSLKFHRNVFEFQSLEYDLVWDQLQSAIFSRYYELLNDGFPRFFQVDGYRYDTLLLILDNVKSGFIEGQVYFDIKSGAQDSLYFSEEKFRCFEKGVSLHDDFEVKQYLLKHKLFDKNIYYDEVIDSLDSVGGSLTSLAYMDLCMEGYFTEEELFELPHFGVKCFSEFIGKIQYNF